MHPLELARNRLRLAGFLVLGTSLLITWAIATIEDVAAERDAAEACPDHGPVIDERYAAGFRDGLQEAREAREGAGGG